jgi:GDP-L-fucose synthase
MESKFYKNKSVLITGGTGLIGRPLINMLISMGANLTVVSLDNNVKSKDFEFIKADLRNFDNCLNVCKGKEIVFQLAGIKGSPAMTQKKPASFFVPTIQMSINMLEAARISGVENYLITSSIGVYSPAEVFYEKDVWTSFPSPNDKFAGWAKRISELQAEAFKIEYGFDNISIVRPANVYGPYDNFDPNNAMVIPSLIFKAINQSGDLNVWGDGSPVRDFVYSNDVASAMIIAVQNKISEPINIGSGSGVSIKEIVNIINKNLPNGPKNILWDTTKPSGDAKRIMDTSIAESYGIVNNTTLDIGIKNTINWYISNKNNSDSKFNVFNSHA